MTAWLAAPTATTSDTDNANSPALTACPATLRAATPPPPVAPSCGRDVEPVRTWSSHTRAATVARVKTQPSAGGLQAPALASS